MKRLPFEDLRSPMEFQQLCVDVLKAEGFKNIRGIGTGPDQGQDALIEVPITSPFGVELQRFVVQCKWYALDNSVGQKEVVADYEYLDLHDAVGLFFITSSRYSGTAVTKMNSIDKSRHHPYQIKFWDGYELTRRLQKHPELITRYWYSVVDTVTHDKHRLIYDEERFLEQYGAPPTRYANVSMASFPVMPENEQYVNRLAKYAEDFIDHPSSVTILEGAIGSGKTGYAWSLLNQKREVGCKVAEISPYDFAHSYFRYALKDDNELLSLLRFLKEVEFLFVDNIYYAGIYDKSNTQVKAANVLVEVIKARISSERPTIFSMVSAEELPKGILKNFLLYLKQHHPVLSIGDTSLRLLKRDNKDDLTDAVDITCKDYIRNSDISSSTLGKSWLVEKYKNIEYQLNQAISVILTPEDIDRAQRLRWKEISGEYQRREEEILDTLQYAKFLLNKYCEYVERCEFQAILFNSDGSVTVVKS